MTGVPMYWDMNISSQWDICTTNNKIVPFGMGLAGALQYAYNKISPRQSSLINPSKQTRFMNP